MQDYNSTRDVLLRILEDNGFNDDAGFKNENEYYADRFTSLNKLLEIEHKRKNSNLEEVKKLKKELKKLKKDNNKLKKEKDKLKTENNKLSKKNTEILSSKSWRITKPLRDLKPKKK